MGAYKSDEVALGEDVRTGEEFPDSVEEVQGCLVDGIDFVGDDAWTSSSPGETSRLLYKDL